MTEGTGEFPTGAKPGEQHDTTGTSIKPAGWHEGSKPTTSPSEGARPYEDHGLKGTSIKPAGWHESK